MDKFIIFCAVGMLTMAFVGCDSSHTSKPIVIDEELASIDPDPTQSEDIKALEVVIRDFSTGFPDFDNFQSEAYESQVSSKINREKYPETPSVDTWKTWLYPGYVDNEDWKARREIPNGYDTYGCGNAQTPKYGIAVGTQGAPHDRTSATGVSLATPDYINENLDASYVWYGEFGACNGGNRTVRGYAHELCTDATETWDDSTVTRRCDKECGAYIWAEKVYITPGMVEQKLTFKNGEDGKLNMLEPVITKARDACDNMYFELWFTDNSMNKTSEGTLELKQKESETGLWYDWNNGGFYPLDSVEDDGKWKSINTKFENQFGPQSLTIYCPPYNYIYASTQTDRFGSQTNNLCSAWLNAGGPRVEDAALTAAMRDARAGLVNLRNSGFTMMGYAPFKYKKGAGKIFEFTSLDDMWVFVDGVMVLDLGGTSSPKKGWVELDRLAVNSHGCHSDDPLQAYCRGKIENDGSWKDDTWHHLHVFYANRHSSNSTLYMSF